MEAVYTLISGLFILLGVVGVFMPVLPGPIFVLIGIFIYAYFTHFTLISLKLIIIFSILTLATILFEYIASLVSVQKFGASKWGTIGMVLGGVVGFLALNVIGMVIGQLLGLVIGELASGKAIKEALKVGGAGIAGLVLNVLLKIMVVGIMVGTFIYKIV